MDQKARSDMFHEIYIKDLILDSSSVIIYQLFNNNNMDIKKELSKKQFNTVQLPAAFVETSKLEFLRKTKWIPVTNNISVAVSNCKEVSTSDFIEATSILINHSALIIIARNNNVFFDVNRLNNLKKDPLMFEKKFTNQPILYQSINLPKFGIVMNRLLHLLSDVGNRNVA